MKWHFIGMYVLGNLIFLKCLYITYFTDFILVLKCVLLKMEKGIYDYQNSTMISSLVGTPSKGSKRDFALWFGTEPRLNIR